MVDENQASDRQSVSRLGHSVEKLAAHMEKARFDEYAAMFSRPVKFIFFNFLAGIARGFGIAVGMTLIVALVVFLLSKMINLPIIGYYIAQVVEMVNNYLAEGKSMLR